VVLNTAPKITTANHVSRVVSMKICVPNKVFQAQMVRIGPMAIKKIMNANQKIHFMIAPKCLESRGLIGTAPGHAV
jgi:hypothetical protein